MKRYIKSSDSFFSDEDLEILRRADTSDWARMQSEHYEREIKDAGGYDAYCRSAKKQKAAREGVGSYVQSSDLGRYVGSRLLTSWTASLLVYGAEESEDYDFEETASDIYFNEALKKLDDFQSIINDNNIDGYLTLEDYNSDYYYEGDYDQICEQLEADGLM